jgi:hypothetical protein
LLSACRINPLSTCSATILSRMIAFNSSAAHTCKETNKIKQRKRHRDRDRGRCRQTFLALVLPHEAVVDPTERERERDRDRQTDRQADRQTLLALVLSHEAVVNM